jgi:hypothetical protein
LNHEELGRSSFNKQERAVMVQKPISEWWDHLDYETQHWLAENPGCVILPRTVVNTINEVAGASIIDDQHGEAPLSPEDQEFIRAKARAMEPRIPQDH